MGLHDSEVVGDECIDRGDAGAMGVVTTVCKGAYTAVVQPGTRGGVCGIVPGWSAGSGTVQDRLDASGGCRDPGPWRQQAILGRGRGRWDGDALRDIVRDYVIEHLAHDDAVLVIDG